ncbi:hypothetical protein NDU88_002277 [Pleurodeles waltl]|uniref:Uncharacterized protein n=1 Tax=Pleurodeles waltl TaxID=8319 RepID=A0AAV7WRV3_PLEWA|nr:hypothetical protein NDU88_002277 [Pleurodeles waltl]
MVTSENPIQPDADDESDDDRVEEPVLRSIAVGESHEPPNPESSPGANPSKPWSLAGRAISSQYGLRSNPVPSTPLQDYLI